MNQKKQLQHLANVLELYESALLKIAEGTCPHKEQIGVGAVLDHPCPVCIAWCAINPKKAAPRVGVAKDMFEVAKARMDLTGERQQ